MKMPKVGDTFDQPPILTGGKTNRWTVISICKPIDTEEPWPAEFKNFFSSVGTPSLFDIPIYDRTLGTMKNQDTGKENCLTETFWKLFGDNKK